MKKFSLTILFSAFIFLTALLAPLASTYAADSTCNPTGDRTMKCIFENPISGSNSLTGLIASVLKQIQAFALMIVALVIMYSGFLIVKSQVSGDTGGLKTAKQALKFSIIAAIIIAGGPTLIKAIQNFVSGF